MELANFGTYLVRPRLPLSATRLLLFEFDFFSNENDHHSLMLGEPKPIAFLAEMAHTAKDISCRLQ